MKRFVVLCIGCILFAIVTFSSSAQTLNNMAFSSTTATYTTIIGQGGTTLIFDPGTSSDDDDGYYTGIPIGFNFSYLGTNYSTMACCANGFAMLGGTSVSGSSWVPDISGSSGALGRPVLAPWWGDLELLSGTGGSSLGYITTGSAPNRVFTLEWNRAEWTYTSGALSLSFQIKLYEASGAVEFTYNQEDAQASSQSMQVGISSTATGSGSYIAIQDNNFNTFSSTSTGSVSLRPASGTLLSFVPLSTALSTPSGYSSTNVLSASFTMNWTNNDATAYANAIYWSTDGTNYTQRAYVATSGTGSYSYNVTGLSGSTTYYFKIYAMSSAGTSPALSGSQTTASGTLSGTRQIPSTNYPTIKSALDSLNQYGLAGSILFELQSNYTSTAETYPLTFGAISGASSTKTITFRPASGATGLVVSGSSSSVLLDLSGAKWVTLDGRPGGTGTTSQLTISNTSTSATVGTIRFISDAQNNAIRYCSILGSSTNTAAGVVYFSTPSTLGNSNDTIANCNIGPTSSSLPPARAVYCSGSGTILGLYNVIDACNIYDYFIASTTNYGIYSSAGYTKWRITNNSFYQTATRTHTASNTIYNIYISASYNPTGQIITGNYIGGSQAGAGGSAMTHTTSTTTLTPIFYGLYCANNSANTDTTIVSGNTVANINFTTASTSTLAMQGIYTIYGNLFINSNVIGSGSATGSITLNNNSTSTGPTFNGIYAYPNAPGAQITLNGNVIGGVNLSTATPASSSNLFIGIFLASTIGATSNVTNNVIGSSSVSSSINAQTASTATVVQALTGIQLASVSGAFYVNCTGNTIANMVNNGNSSTSGADYVRGIYGSSGVHNISGNTVRNLYNAAPNISSTNTTMSVVGILEGSTTAPVGLPGHVISSNNVHTLVNTNTTASSMWVVGLSMNSSAASQVSAQRNNLVHSLATQTSGTSVIVGSILFTGPSLLANNMFRLGVDATGTSLSNSIAIYGIYKNNATIANIVNNTVYIGGTNVTGTSNSFCIWRAALPASGSDVIRNNIFQNARTNGSGSGAHCCLLTGNASAASAAVAVSQMNLNNNLYYHAGSGGYIGGILYTPGSTFYIYSTIPTWNGASSQDGASGYSAPGLVFPTGTSANLNLHITGTTAARGGGAALTTVTDDFDGESRPSSSPDIGADQCNSCTAVDIYAPIITYTPLASGIVDNNRTLSNVTITDYSGVNTTSGTRPRVYFKKSTDADTYVGNTSTDNGWKWTEATGTSSPFSFLINYAQLQSSVSVGDVIQYFIIAQDQVGTPNVGVNACAFTTYPTSVNLSSTNFASANARTYTISTGVSGTINVGPAETITSLTNTGGAFDYINQRVVTGNIVLNITGNSTAETGSVALNETAEYGTGGYTVTIRPATSTVDTISGTYTGGLVRLNGADRVIIDGRYVNSTTGRNLTFINNSSTSPSATLLVGSLGNGAGATRDTIRYCNISTGTTGSGSVSTFGIYAGTSTITTPGSTSTTSGGSGDDNDFLCITNNFIDKAAWGIYARGTASGVLDSVCITNNTIGAPRDSTTRFIGWAGIEVQQINNSLISGNTIMNIITGNTNPKGILLGTGVQNTRVSNNLVRNLRYTGTGGYGGKGIDVYTGFANCNVTIANNMITSIFGDGWSTFTSDAIVGIRIGNSVNALNGGVNVYHNTVVLRDTTSPTTSTYSSAALYVGASAVNLNIADNIFMNSLRNTAATQTSYAFYSDAPASSYSVLNYNNYYAFGTQGVMAYMGGAQRATLSALQAVSGKDQNSLSVPVAFISDSTDLHLPGIMTNLIGTSISGITTDYDNVARTKPYIGADEVVPVLTITQQPSSATLCVGQALNLSTTLTTPVQFNDNVSRTSPTLTYQWYKGAAAISGATTSSYSISSVTTADAATYSCRIWASTIDSTTTTNAVVVVNTLPAITQDPVSASRCLGSTTSLSGAATGTGVTYQWQKLNGATWSNVSGATNSTLTFASMTAGDFGSYRLVASGACTPAATSAVAVLTQLASTVISNQPTATPSSLCLGANFTLSVTATASNIGYQWRKNLAPITGATSSTLTITNAQASDFGTYSVVVTGDCGSVTSNDVIVSQIAPTVITSQPSTSTPQVCLGQPFTINMSATGAALTYQWRKNLVAISGATTNSYSVASATAADFASYDIVVTGTCGSLTSQSVTIVQIPSTVISTHPTPATTLCQGGTYNLSVTATGANITYQWQKQSGASFNPIVGATNATFSISNVAVADAGTYRVVVTGTCGALTSNIATLTVQLPINITQQPAWSASSACTGETSTLSMTATGTITTYQWQKFDGATWQNIAGATNNTYTIASLVLSDAGSYRMQLTGPCSATTISNQATISVQQNVVITTNPQPQTACVGSSISFSITTVGTVVGYQWEQDRLQNGTWVPISGATTATYTKSGVTTLDSGLYRVKVTGNCSAIPVVSGTALATIQSIFNIITQPTWPSTPTNVGQVVSLTVSVTGTANFQWQRDQQRNGSWVNVGTNSPNYSYTIATVADSGNFRCVVSGPCGAVTQNTNTASVFTCQPPVVTTQPQAPQPVCVGGTLSLSVIVNSQGQAITYQWQVDAARNGTWVTISGGTNSTYTKTNVQSSDDGFYRVQIISACSSVPVFSNSVSFVVLASNSVLTHPVSQTVCAGQNVTLSITAGGASPSYQWYYNGAPMNIGQTPSAQTANLQLTSVTAGSAGTYSCFVTGPCTPNGTFSNSATLTVNSPVIMLQPQSQTGCVGTPVTFTTQVTGTGMTYQWQKNAVAIGGATNSSYTIASPVAADAGTYRVLATNSCGTVTSANAVLSLTVPAAFVTQPTSQTVCRGTNMTVSVAVNADATSPSYQWQRNGVNLSTSTYPTANTASLTVPNIQASEAGSYTCVVITPCQPVGVSSNAATINVNPSTAIVAQPVGSTICEGTLYTFSTGAVGTTLSYQWYKDLNPIIGATNNTYTIPSTVGTDAGSYMVIVGGACAPVSVSSNAAVLVVNTNPRITAAPLSNQSACQGGSVTFTTAASGTGLNYQWRFNGSAIVGNASAATASLTLTNITTANAGNYDCVITGVCSPSGVTTNLANLVVNTPIAVQSAPLSSVVCTRSVATFSVTTTGSGPTYQWRLNGVPISGNASALTATLVIPSVTTADAGSYTVAITGTCNTVISSAATLTVQTGLSITSQPDAQRLCVGSTISTGITVTGTLLGYQWQLNGVNIPGQTNSTLILPNAQVAQSGGYRCVVSGSTACGTSQQVSNTVEILVGTAATITKQPSNTAVSFGATVSAQVDAAGLGYGVNNVLQYAWFKGATRLTDGSHISGSNSNILTIRGVLPADIGNDYYVVVTGICGNVTSNQFSLFVPTVNVTGQPQAATVCSGGNTVFSVVAVPTPATSQLYYQWFKGTTALVDGPNISGATTSSLTVSNISASDAGDYTCEITVQPGGLRVTTNVAKLDVNTQPAISSQPSDVTSCLGSPLTLTVGATGGGLTYQWSKGGTTITGATSGTLTIPAATANDAGTYSVSIRNSCGTVTSNTANATITTGPVVTTQPVSQTVGVNAVFTLSTAATGTGPISYQWKLNGVAIANATNATYTKSGTTKSDEGKYTCDVTNGCGTVTSSEATISISTVGVLDAELYGFSLSTPEPNPMSDRATVHVVIPTASVLTLDVVDLSGRVVATLLNGPVEAGVRTETLDAVNNNLVSGTYLLRLLTSDGFMTTKRVLIVR